MNRLPPSPIVKDYVSCSDAIPVHFFTLVLNGQPFIGCHVEQWQQLPFEWHWHIVEGAAELNHDTGWSKPLGGRMLESHHRRGLSTDGTTKYLDELAARYPSQITLYRKPDGQLWDGKVEMVNAPLPNVPDGSLLWEVDVDELWTARQVEDVRKMFIDDPAKLMAAFSCWYFVGPSLIVARDDVNGKLAPWPKDEWLRVWRLQPKSFWAAHEPPTLVQLMNGLPQDTYKSRRFSAEETARKGAVFQHFSYVLEEQVQFKQDYYGYRDAVDHWREVQHNTQWPLDVKRAFHWWNYDAQTDGVILPCAAVGIEPLWRPTKDKSPALIAAAPLPRVHLTSRNGRLLWLRPDAIGDNVLASAMLPHIKKHYKGFRITTLCDERVADLYKDCPFVEEVTAFNRKQILKDAKYRAGFFEKIERTAIDLCINSVYSPEPLTLELLRAAKAKEVIGVVPNAENMMAGMWRPYQEAHHQLLGSGPECGELERHLRFLQELGISVEQLSPTVWIGPDDENFADRIFHANDLVPESTITLFAGAQGTKRLYHHYGEAIDSIDPSHISAVLVLGAEADLDINNFNVRQIHGRKIVNLVGQTTLLQSAALVRRCRLAVGAETGLAHIAAAVSVPTVVLVGGGHFGRFFPYPSRSNLVVLPMDCFGCQWRCKHPRTHCVEDISPSLIESAIRTELLKPTSTARIFVPEDHRMIGKLPEAMQNDKNVELVKIPISRAVTAKVSILIITNSGLPEHAHRREYLLSLLKSIMIAGFPDSVEVIISGAIPTGIGATHLIDRPDAARNGKVSELRNAAVSKSTGDILIHCDDDIVFTRGYWEGVSRTLKQTWDVACVRLLNPNGTRYWDWAAYYPGKGQTLLPYDVEDSYVYATGGHAIFRRQVFDKVKWNEKRQHGQNEEFDFAADSRHAGLKYVFNSHATVYLQFHHCDALAVISGEPQNNKEQCSNEFEKTMKAIQGSPVRTADSVDVKERFRHKVACTTQAKHTGAKPTVSILVACYRYLQRFRIFARSLASQEFDLDRVEVIVANPHSPDGLSEFLQGLQNTRPKFRQVLSDQSAARNRGLLIQKAFEHSSGEVLIGMDCDLVLPPNFLARLVPVVWSNPNRIVGVYRNFLSQSTTAKILNGRIDPMDQFDTLLQEDSEEEQGYRGVLGYCQALQRDKWQQVGGYPTEFDQVNQSDVTFADRLSGIGVSTLFLRDLVVLHLNHVRDWTGTKVAL